VILLYRCVCFSIQCVVVCLYKAVRVQPVVPQLRPLHELRRMSEMLKIQFNIMNIPDVRVIMMILCI